MQLRGIAWVGTRTAQFDEMVAFASNVLGLTASRSEDGLAAFPLENGDTLEISTRSTTAAGIPTALPPRS